MAFLTSKCTKNVLGRRSTPTPLGELASYDAAPDPLVGWGGDTPSPYPLRCLLRLGTYGASVLAYHFYTPSVAAAYEQSMVDYPITSLSRTTTHISHFG